MPEKSISYSTLLLDFIEPLLNVTETEDELSDKAKAGMMAWNFHVSDLNELSNDDHYKEIILKLTTDYAEANEILNSLVIRKQMYFSHYNQFILKVEIKAKSDGSKTLYVESANADKIKK